ncbi:MAG: hypothetical protein GC187_07910 [Alphaproteobacteria bacterium]|nr:hypothetical protein [Alphaproteobacteria bacterium]
MRQIIYALSGAENSPPVLDRQLERFVQRLRDDVEDIIWDASFRGHRQGPELYTLFQELGDADKIRLFLSPQGFEAIYAAARRCCEDNVAALIETARSFTRTAQDEIWPCDTPVDPGCLPSRLRLGDTIIVDIGTELCRRVDLTSPILFMPYEALTWAETETVRRKLHDALSEIDAFAPSLARMIRNYTRTIYVRKIGDLPPSSEQVDTELGAIRLRNIHGDLYHHDQIVDDLIHESTHNLLGTYEYLNFPFIPVGFRPSPNVRPVSPWSLRPIQVLPFIHAAFVYFAMLTFAQRRLDRGIDDPALRQRFVARRNRYASGFLMPGQLSEFASSLTDIDPRVARAMDWMQQAVRASTYGAMNTPGRPGADVRSVA